MLVSAAPAMLRRAHPARDVLRRLKIRRQPEASGSRVDVRISHQRVASSARCVRGRARARADLA
eukprot:8059926-Pyramimonas_sp.AAC.1